MRRRRRSLSPWMRALATLYGRALREPHGLALSNIRVTTYLRDEVVDSYAIRFPPESARPTAPPA